MQIPPDEDSFSILLAILTLSPKISPSLRITSPRWRPILRSTLFLNILWILVAQSIASVAESKQDKVPSPISLI